jgi:hypothetical protein
MAFDLVKKNPGSFRMKMNASLQSEYQLSEEGGEKTNVMVTSHRNEAAGYGGAD